MAGQLPSFSQEPPRGVTSCSPNPPSPPVEMAGDSSAPSQRPAWFSGGICKVPGTGLLGFCSCSPCPLDPKGVFNFLSFLAEEEAVTALCVICLLSDYWNIFGPILLIKALAAHLGSCTKNGSPGRSNNFLLILRKSTKRVAGLAPCSAPSLRTDECSRAYRTSPVKGSSWTGWDPSAGGEVK